MLTESNPKPFKDPLSIDGWMGADELEWLAVHAARCETIVEVGSWKGLSTAALLNACPGIVHAVDHFQGSFSELATTHKEATHSDIYAQFLANVGAYSNLQVHRMGSLEASAYFEDGSIEMIFIDGSHDKQEVLADIKAWRPKCKRLLCGHDFNFVGVHTALAELGIRASHGAGSIWYTFVNYHYPETARRSYEL